MNLVFVHGWSVTDTDTYGELAKALSAIAADHGISLAVSQINLAKYISFHDEVTLDDISRAMDTALREMPGNTQAIQDFSCITHSTGGPVVRNWLELYYGSRKLDECPLRHLIMLAPANHGSALGALGKQRVGRMKAWFGGVEPGQRVLDWLSLGSTGQWELNERHLSCDLVKHQVYPFVLTGQGIDRKLYDFLNSYLKEPGSDGVVRVAGANMNYRFLRLEQTSTVLRKSPLTLELEPPTRSTVRIPKPTALGVFENYSHSGKDMGIMRSVTSNAENPAPIVEQIMKCLAVKTPEDYSDRSRELTQLTETQQQGKSRYAMLVLNIHDETGAGFARDAFDVFLLYGSHYRPEDVPKGFFQDRQLNTTTNRLVYYIDADKMSPDNIENPLFGIRIIVRPDSGFAYHCAGEFRSKGYPIAKIIAPNETTYIDITLKRQVDKNVFRLIPASEKTGSFKSTKPSGETLP